MGSGSSASISPTVLVAQAMGDISVPRAKENKHHAFIVNGTACQGVDWKTYDTYFDNHIDPKIEADFA
jgi:hypothetical protein